MSDKRIPRLEDYRKKRDPARTPEPFDAKTAAKVGPYPIPPLPGPRFVVQKHWARNMHYDLRLELDGTLKSWAVPRGPSTRVEEKRLAVHVEDHPIEYGRFEGVIPAGNYGAGSVIVWDHGWFRSFKPEDIQQQYQRGKLELEMFGYKLRGRWTLVRMGRKDKEWLLLKKDDGAANDVEAIDRHPESVITGLTVEEMKDLPGTMAALADLLGELGAPRGAVAVEAGVAPAFMLATLANAPPRGNDWTFEIKYDGVRVLAGKDGDDVLMLGRSGENITARYPELAAALAALPASRFLVDGEIVAEDETGRPSFQLLQARMRLTRPRDVIAVAQEVPVRAIFFDCLALEGHDLRRMPLERRLELLSRTLPPLGVVSRSPHWRGDGDHFLAAANDVGLEGIVGKKLSSTYSGRRSPEWVKIKCQRRQEFVIGGWSDPQGSRAAFGALHIGVHEDGKLVYVTKVGTGFDDALLASIAKLMKPLERATTPFEVDSPGGKGNHWVEPRLVCEVRFTEWTREGGLRHPTFLGLRTDKKPEDMRREEVVPEIAEVEPIAAEADAAAEEPAPRPKRAAKAAARPAARELSAPGRISAATPAANRVHVTNPTKKFWPDGATKGDLVAYYEAIAPWMLLYLRDRPIVLTRFPDGIDGKSFFQKDAPPYVKDYPRTVVVHHDDAERDIRYFVLDDVESLRYVANMGTIPIHAWSSRASTLEHPDWMVLDLDPKGAPFTDVVRVARVVKETLDDLGLPSYPKTSGATGLHILVPMGQQYTHEEARTFARVLAMLVVEQVPDISTVTRAVQARGGKVYVDFGQNGRGNTIVAPFSVRPLPGAPASCPLRWDEVTGRLDPAKFTIRTIPPRFAEMEDPLAPVMGAGIDMAAALARIQRRIQGEGEPEPKARRAAAGGAKKRKSS